MGNLYWTQVAALTKKNFTLLFRSFRNFIVILLVPIIITGLIFYFEHLITVEKAMTRNPNPELRPVEKIPHCTGSKDCVSVGYFVVGPEQPWIGRTMETLALNNQLGFGSDVKMLLQGSPAEINKYVQTHRNQTQIAVIFCTKSWDIFFDGYTLEIPCTFDRLSNKTMAFYSIYYNMTLGFQTPYFFKLNSPYPTNGLVVSLKKSLDEALLTTFTNSTFKLSISTRSFPTTENKFFKDYDFVSTFGSFFFYLPMAVISLVRLFTPSNRADERENEGNKAVHDCLGASDHSSRAQLGHSERHYQSVLLSVLLPAGIHSKI